MPNVSQQKNIGAYLKGAYASLDTAAPALIVAGGAGDNVEQTGDGIDTLGAGSGKVITGFLAALADTETLSLRLRIQESDDDITYDAAEELIAPTVVATSSGGTNEAGVQVFDVDLSGRKRYVRFLTTPDLSAAGVDTAYVMTVLAFNDDVYPAT
jgi:hypothetical protein